MVTSPPPPPGWKRPAGMSFKERAAVGLVDPRARESIDTSAFEPAFTAIRRGLPVTLVLGGAGTGKTTFLRELKKEKDVKQVFLAPTGVAALNLGGQTIHSFFGIPPRIIDPAEVAPRAPKKRLFGKLERVIIDEISMVRADLLDTVDRTLRVARNRQEPFGGVQMVLVGDFFQLPPVVPRHEEEVLARLGYHGPFAFDAKALEDIAIGRVAFQTVHRQTERQFIDILNRIRRDDQVVEALEALNERCVHPHRPGHTPILLAPTNATADRYNFTGMNTLTGDERVFVGEAKGDFAQENRDRLPAPERLALKVGARVMALRNDPMKRWVNGSVGTVQSLDANGVVVRFDDGETAEIERASWEKIRYEWNEETGQVAAVVTGSFSQFPLAPAWALTIHKAQGLTLSDVRVDFDHGAFAAGQTYVALSRARTLDGLSLTRPVRFSDIRTDRRVQAFMRAFEG